MQASGRRESTCANSFKPFPFYNSTCRCEKENLLVIVINVNKYFAIGLSYIVIHILNSNLNTWFHQFVLTHVNKRPHKDITLVLGGSVVLSKENSNLVKSSFHLHVHPFSQELQAHVDQITEMAAVMRKAIEIDEHQGCKEQERIFQLEQENKGLREILQITRESFLNLRKDDASESTSLSALVTNSDLSLRKS